MRFDQWWEMMRDYIGEDSDARYPLTRERAKQVRRLARRTCRVSNDDEACGTCFAHMRMLLDEIDAWGEEMTRRT